MTYISSFSRDGISTEGALSDQSKELTIQLMFLSTCPQNGSKAHTGDSWLRQLWWSVSDSKPLYTKHLLMLGAVDWKAIRRSSLLMDAMP